MPARKSDSTNKPVTSASTTPQAQIQLAQVADELRKAVLDLVWRQWRALGAGAASRSGAGGRELNTLIDPEALVLVSLALVSDERRLVDLLHDWAARNADLLSVQRMKNLEADYPESVRDALVPRLCWFAGVARNVGKDLRWRSVAQAWEDLRELRSRTAPASEPMELIVRDAHKSRATRARLTSSATLMLRLRLGFGVGVKADLLAFLIARAEAWATVREIADATVYTPAAVRRAAEDLAAARLVQSLEGQPASYRVMYGAWAPWLELDDRRPGWGSWHQRFAFSAAFLHEAIRERPISAYAVGVKGRDLMERYRPVFERDLIAVWSDHSAIEDWAAYCASAVRALARYIEEMA